ncbi:MAG: hypothetical protein R3Y46_00835 [Opitutales bacterium]
MNKAEKAVEIFRNPYSCAQAVAVAFKGELSQGELDELKANSGGKAEGGICGALYAACQISNDKEGTCAEFEKRAGHIRCIDLKTKGRVSCDNCVRIASEILADKS